MLRLHQEINKIYISQGEELFLLNGAEIIASLKLIKVEGVKLCIATLIL